MSDTGSSLEDLPEPEFRRVQIMAILRDGGDPRAASDDANDPQPFTEDEIASATEALNQMNQKLAEWISRTKQP